ncbi:MAG: phosphatidylserine decarboxylase family protein [Bacteroidales bacterium]|nr:phosphatidylserine decarboxylase family protein [Bacteroidales bacterium]
MKIHKEGHKIIFIMLVIVGIINLLINWYFPKQTPFHGVVYGVSVVFLFLVVRFFRIPVRNFGNDDNHIISSADGKVVVIEETDDPEYPGGKCRQISVFMSIFNIHINWFPINGKVKYIKYHPGKYLVAYHPKASMENEMNSVLVEGMNEKNVLVRQIAGAVARRIVCSAHEEDKAHQGHELGIIKFGSRVDMLLPLDAKVEVKIGQKVKGGETLIATFD